MKFIAEFPGGAEYMHYELIDFLASLVHKELEMQLSYVLKRFLIKVDIDDY